MIRMKLMNSILTLFPSIIFFYSFFRMIMFSEPRMENGRLITWNSGLIPADFIFIASISCSSTGSCCSSIW